MNFVDPAFLIFFCLFLVAYYRVSPGRQNLLITVASYFFYGWFDWRFCFLLFATTAADFYFGLVIDQAKHSGAHRLARLTVIASVTCNLIVLGFFKYFNFFIDSAEAISDQLGIEANLPILRVILPAGISFYIFQSLSYIFDVYDGKVRATYRFVDYTAFVSFFPHLVAGPILRAKDLLPKLMQKRAVTTDMIIRGCYLALYGFFTKLVIADNLAPIVNAAYQNPNARGGALIIATYAFAFQIYADFMGYTLIARGIARMMGFELVLNFNLPYFSTGPREFWKRWHISLSTWLRDYLYIRIGGNHGTRSQTYRNLAVTMLLGGLWHGAAWNFVLWGAYHGGLLIAAHALPQLPTRLPLAVRAILFFQLVCIGWLMFRANGLADLVVKTKAILFSTHVEDLLTADAAKLLAICVPLIAFEIYQYRTGDLEPWLKWRPAARVVWCAALLTAIGLFKTMDRNPFIYFAF